MMKSRWPRAPVEVGEYAWFYISRRGLAVYIEQYNERNIRKAASVTIPWRDVLSAMGWWRRNKGGR